MEIFIGGISSALVLAILFIIMKPRMADKAPHVPFDDSGLVGQLATHEATLKSLEQAMIETRAAVAEGINHVERVENRIKATVRRAQEKLSEHGYESPGLNAEAAQLQLLDGGGGEESQLPEMRPGLAEAPSPFPGMSRDDINRVLGGGRG